MSTFLSTLLRGIVHVENAGVPTPDRPTVNFVGLTVADNPTKNRVDVSFLGNVVNLSAQNADFTSNVLFESGFQSDGDINVPSIWNYNSTGLTQGFMRWEPSGLMGIWATRLNGTHAKILDFDATTGACTLGDDSNSTYADMRAGTSGEVRHYVAGGLKFRMTSTGVGYFGSTPVRPTLSGSCGGNAGAYSVGSALIALGLCTNGGTFAA